MSRRAKVTTWIIILLVLFGGTSFWFLNKYYDWFKFGADAIVGCQRTGDISAFFGRPGTNLTQYNLFGNEITVNQKIAPFLDQIQPEVVALNTGYSFDRIDGYNYRWKSAGGGWSLHSWGIAVDINPDRNPYQPGNWDEPQKDIPDGIINVFKKYGFAWGGDWAGQRDSMHFEWYGAELAGSIVDANTRQKILDATALVNGAGAPVFNGDYTWLLEAKTHSVKVLAKGYEDAEFKVDLFCFQRRPLEITLKPLPENLPGSISGNVRLADGSPLLMPATIYLDDKAIATSNVAGDYAIDGVQKGVHKITAKILLFPGTTIATPNLSPGENLTNFNLVIGTQ